MRRILIVVVSAAAAIGIGGAAWAAIPDANGEINACYTRLGTLRVIDTEAGARCVGVERNLKWNQTGPQGALGPAGPPGPAGTSNVIVGRFGGHWPILDDTTETLQGLQLPNVTATYLIEATVRAHTDILNEQAFLYCDLYAGAQQLDWVIFNFAADQDFDRESVQLTGWLDATGFEVVELRCRADYEDPNGLGSNIGIDDHGAVVATRVDTLTEAP